MRAAKGNREYVITEEQKAHYLRDGFDIYDDSGKKIASGKGKSVTQEEYDALRKELEDMKGLSVSDDEVLPILKEYAQMKGIEIGQATSVKGILKKISEAGEQ